MKSNGLISSEVYSGYESYSFRFRDLVLAFLIFVVIFTNYILTLTPSVAAGDHGELATTTYVMGAPHPSGYPSFAILGKFFTYLPFGNIAYRVNLMSAFSGAMTAALFFLFTLKVLGIRKPQLQRNIEGIDLKIYIPAVLSGLMFGFSNLLWNQSIIGEVYSLHSLLTGIVLISLILWYEDVISNYYSTKEPYIGSRYLVLLFFSMGLSFTNHHLSIGYIIPISVVVAVVIFSALYNKVDFSLSELIQTKGLIIIGFLISLLLGVVLFYYNAWVPRRPLTQTEAIIATVSPLLPLVYSGIVGFLYNPLDKKSIWIKEIHKTFFWSIFFFIVPIYIYYSYLWIRSVAIYNMPEAEIRVMSWGEIRTLDVLWTHVLRKQYGALAGSSVVINILQIWDLIKLHLNQFHILLVVLSIPGFIGLFKKDINLFFSLLFIWFTFLVLFLFFVMGEPVDRARSFYSVFLLQSYFVFAIFIAQGMQTVMDWLSPKDSKS